MRVKQLDITSRNPLAKMSFKKHNVCMKCYRVFNKKATRCDECNGILRTKSRAGKN